MKYRLNDEVVYRDHDFERRGRIIDWQVAIDPVTQGYIYSYRIENSGMPYFLYEKMVFEESIKGKADEVEVLDFTDATVLWFYKEELKE